MTGRDRELRDHEQELTRLLDELGRVLGRRERLFDGIRRHRNRARMEKITEEAERPFDELGQDELLEGLLRELDLQRNQELELREVVEVLELQRRIEDRLFQELLRYGTGEERILLSTGLDEYFDRRERLFENVETLSLQEMGKQIWEMVRLQNELEDRLYPAVEERLIRIRRERGRSS